MSRDRMLTLFCPFVILICTAVPAQDTAYCRDAWWPAGPARSAAAADDVAALGAGAMLELYDLTALGLPVKTGSVGLPDVINGIALRNNRVFVAADEAGLRVIDIGDPSHPFEVSGLAEPPGSSGSCRALDVAVAGDLAFVADHGLRVIDVSNSSAPFERGHLPGQPVRLAVREQLVFLVDGSQLDIVSVTNPANPAVVGSFSVDALDVAVGEGIAYLATESNGIRVVDVTTPASPVELGGLQTDGPVYTITVVEDRAFVVTGEEFAGDIVSTKLQVVDVSDPATPQLLNQANLNWPGEYGGWGEHVEVAINESKVLVPTPDEGMHVFTINRGAPLRLGSIRTPGPASDVAIFGQKAVLVDDAFGLFVVDLTNPNNPLIGQLELFNRRPGGCSSADRASVVTDQRYAFITETCRDSTPRGALHVVDLMTPEQPIRVGLLELDFSVVDVEILDQTLFMITEYPGRVLTVDVSQPEAPLVTGEPFGSVSVHGLAARGNRLYVTTGSSQEAHQVTVYDVRDPYSPFSVASIETNGERFAGIAADANSSYAVDYRTDVSGSDTRTGLRVFGWRSGFTFEQVGFLSLPDSGFDYYDVRSLAVGHDRVFIDSADPLLTAGGVVVVNVSDPSNPVAEAFVDLPEPLRAVAVIGTRVVVAADDAGLQVISPCRRTPRQPSGRVASP